MVTWKINGIFKADAQKVYDEITSLGDKYTPEEIVYMAKEPDTELHKCFEWDDTKAAHKYRIIFGNRIPEGNNSGTLPVRWQVYRNRVQTWRRLRKIRDYSGTGDCIMERIGYDPHRINPPDEPDPEAVCESCGAYMYPSDGDPVYFADGEILCEDCLKSRFIYHIEEVYQ